MPFHTSILHSVAQVSLTEPAAQIRKPGCLYPPRVQPHGTIGHVVAGMMLTFSAMLLYIPTFAAVIWPLARVQDVEAEPNEALSRTERDDRA
jgi:hypothetical protein